MGGQDRGVPGCGRERAAPAAGCSGGLPQCGHQTPLRHPRCMKCSVKVAVAAKSCLLRSRGVTRDAGTIRVRRLLCDEMTPEYRVTWRRKGSTRVASRTMRANGEISIEVVPSDQGRLKSSLTAPSGKARCAAGRWPRAGARYTCTRLLGLSCRWRTLGSSGTCLRSKTASPTGQRLCPGTVCGESRMERPWSA